jgi:hypothetical protein
MTTASARVTLQRSGPALTALAVLLAVIVGFVLADNYGMSTDERANYLVGIDALQSYLSPAQYADYLERGEPLAHHGPSYFMAFALVSKAISAVNPRWSEADGRHLANYLAFLIGLAGFYSLSLRLLPRRYARMTTLLVATQPLLFGQAFVNQKDTPFLAFFTASVAVGLLAVDAAGKPRSSEPQVEPVATTWQAMKKEWSHARRIKRWVGVAYILVFGGVVLDWIAQDPGLAGLKVILLEGSAGRLWSPLPGVIAPLASSASPLETQRALVSWSYWVGRMATVVALIAAAPLVARYVLPDAARAFWRGNKRTVGLLALAGGLLGFTVSIRAIGAFAGALVSLYWIYRLRAKGSVPLVAYWGIAAWVSYCTWPYLWEAPLKRLWESIALHAEFAIQPTLYRGEWFFSNNLPWHYFPTLATIELTEPVAILFLVGVGVLTSRIHHKTIDRGAAAIVGLWLAIPIVGLLVFGMDTYNNIRQLHFVLVPVFLFAGLGLSSLLSRVKKTWIEYGLFSLLILPGLIGIIRLHPYEYTYFNAYAGGVRGAEGAYSLEYWCTSLREAMEYVNRVAQAGDVVMVSGPHRSARPYAKEGLEVIPDEGSDPASRADFVLTCYQSLGHDWGEDGLPLVHVIGRQSAVFAEVFQRDPPRP